MSADKKVPEIRFKGFSGEWEETDFSNIATRVSMHHQSTYLPCIEYEDIVAGKGRFNKDIHQKKIFKAGLKFEVDDVLFGKLRPYLKNWFLADFEGLAVGDFWVLRAKNTACTFLYSLIQTNKFELISNLSTGSKMPRSDWELVSSSCFFVPKNINESSEIGNYFQKLDSLINQHQQKHDTLSNIKKAMLEKMFPKQGETVPEIRFKGFSDEWVKIGLLDTIDKIIDFRGRTPKKLGLDWSPSGYRALSALNVKQGYIDFSIDPHFGDQELYDKWMSGSELHPGQVLFTTEAPMGNVAQVPNNDKYILSQRTIAFVVKPEIIMENYLAVLLRSPKVFRELTALSSGGTAKGVSQKVLANLNVFIPVELVEQTAIGNYFQKLDTLINQHQQQITKLNHIKQACLSKMFI